MRKLFFLVLLLTCCLSACARIKGGQQEDIEFHDADRLIEEKRYSEAAAAYAKIARESFGTERGARALFFSASARAFYDNPKKDYATALQELDEFLRVYPNSENIRDAQNWRYIIKMVLELKKENEHLTKSIEELKRIDIRHEERRRK